jgi:type I restriction enzyme S subunit
MTNLVPDGWRAEKLDKISRVVDSAHQTPIFSDAGYPMVRVGDIKGGKITLENTKYVPQDIFKIFTKNHKPTFNDLLMTRVGSYGRCSIVKSQREFCLGQNTVVINPQSVDSDYLFYFLQTENINNQIEDTVGGSSQKSLSLGAIKSLNILTPVKREQQKIAQILTSVDEVIEKTQAQIDKLKDLKTAMMQELLTQGVCDENGKRHVEFKDSPVGRIPVGWDVLSLKNICNRITDGTHQAVKTTSGQGIPFLYVSCIKNGKILWDKAAKLTDDIYEIASKGRKPSKGDILYTAVGSYGNAALVLENIRFSFQRHIAYIQPNHDRVYPEFLSEYLNSIYGKEQADYYALGNAQLSITLGDLGKFKIKLPCLQEQKKICDALTSINSAVDSKVNKFRALVKIKKALMQDLLTGKVRVNTEQSNPALAVG